MSPPDASLQRLPAHLAAVLLSWRSACGWVVGFSGGLDSSVLLHALVALAREGSCPPISAVHVHHGLQLDADAWVEHCQRICDQLGVPLTVCHVAVEARGSVEAAARKARHAAFERELGAGQVLLCAQHRDDQAETVMFRLLRGAGLRGLAAMRPERRLGRGYLLRPLLDVGREELECYARSADLQRINDPSNGDVRFARNFLRHEVLPSLTSRWPKLSSTLARTADHLREAQGLLDELAVEDLAVAHAQPLDWLQLPCLALQPLQALSPARQRNAIRHWLAAFTLMPDTAHWAGWLALCKAAADANPIWHLHGGSVRRCAGYLWWVADGFESQPGPQRWPDLSEPLALGDNGILSIQGTVASGAAEVRYRQGGEWLSVPGRGRRDLKRLLNEQCVPAFLRHRLPLLFIDGELRAVANLESGHNTGRSWQLKWLPPTNASGLS